MQPLDIRGIANYILDKSPLYGIKGLNPFRLMELVYLVHGWSKAFDDVLCIKKNQLPKAWEYCITYADIWDALSKYSANTVKERIIDKGTDFPFGINLTLYEKDFIDTVLRRYRDKTGYQLSLITQAKNSPYYKARKKGIENISIDDMKDYFLQLRKTLCIKGEIQ